MKKTVLTLPLMLALVVLMIGVPFVDEASCAGSLVVTVDSPEDRMYNSSSVVISISASDPTNLTGPEAVAYSLDGEPQVIIATAPLGAHSLNGSAVLSLPNGVHEIVGVGITWFNGTADGIFFSEPVHFTVDSPIDYVPTSPSPLPSEEPQLSEEEVILGVTVTVAVLVAGLGLLVYLIKRK